MGPTWAQTCTHRGPNLGPICVQHGPIMVQTFHHNHHQCQTYFCSFQQCHNGVLREQKQCYAASISICIASICFQALDVWTVTRLRSKCFMVFQRFVMELPKLNQIDVVISRLLLCLKRPLGASCYWPYEAHMGPDVGPYGNQNGPNMGPAWAQYGAP
jgi:hypothetical protein